MTFARIRIRRDDAANWQRKNPVLDDGEPGLDKTAGKIKVGNGTLPWNDLPYVETDVSGMTQGPPGAKGDPGPKGDRGDPGPAGASGTIFAIWAEENSSLATGGGNEWAFGNGANTPSNQGVVVPMACELYAATLCLRQGTASVGVYKNGALVATVVQAVAAAPGYVSLTLGSPVAFAPGDCVGFRTILSVGTSSPNTVTAWMRTT